MLDGCNGEGMTEIRIQVEGLDTVIRNIDAIGADLPRYIMGAGKETADNVLSVQGLRKYPPRTRANQPPPPYYIRKRGTQLASRNLENSEMLGTRWNVKSLGGLSIEISNPVSYAEWVHGERQARAMRRIGWKKLSEVAIEKVKTIEAIYNKWINKLVERHKL